MSLNVNLTDYVATQLGTNSVFTRTATYAEFKQATGLVFKLHAIQSPDATKGRFLVAKNAQGEQYVFPCGRSVEAGDVVTDLSFGLTQGTPRTPLKVGSIPAWIPR